MNNQPMPEHKPPPFRLVRFVEVPRAVLPKYWSRTWAEVVTAAQAGTDGLKTIDENIFFTTSQTPETAWLRAQDSTGGCLLFRQHWVDDTNDKKWRHV
jgi:hypothetical protein